MLKLQTISNYHTKHGPCETIGGATGHAPICQFSKWCHLQAISPKTLKFITYALFLMRNKKASRTYNGRHIGFFCTIKIKETRFFATPPTFLVKSFSQLPDRISRLSLTKVITGIFIFEIVCPVQPIKIINKGSKQEVGSNLKKSLRYQHQTWYIGGRHYNMFPCEKLT